MSIRFPRATTWPIGGEDFVIDTILLKRARKFLRDGGAPDMHESEIEGVLLAAEKAAETLSIRRDECPDGKRCIGLDCRAGFCFRIERGT